MGHLFTPLSRKSSTKRSRNIKDNICHWIPAYQGNDGRVVDENLWFRLCRVRYWKNKNSEKLYLEMKGPFNLGAKR
uniref:Uncharacterized protein n=1 Tax=Candidatus Kentrum sp. UNK TaxID=2126344 RepID=A0A451AXZ4_9GAMM|nr:MAG: hypothetical protein BECKUNK1418H_GA0071006_104310 [Candidatus Kentron sp. UNK]